MINDFQLTSMKMCSFYDKGFDVVNKYASLGYFHCLYLKSLPLESSYTNFVRNDGRVRKSNSMLNKGTYIIVSTLDFKIKRKVSCMFLCKIPKEDIHIKELIDLINEVYSGIELILEECFVKFDMYTL